ncbi:hypothetical protein ACHQM5_004974 [Ranunculus cassubicifolius]
MKNSISGQSEDIMTSSSDFVHRHGNIYDNVRRKLCIGARMIQGGGVQKIFTEMFGVQDEEKLLKVSPCYLSTATGPIAGFLFISTKKITFCSERSLMPTASSGEATETSYKVILPLKKIRGATESENVNKPMQKYVKIATVDNFDFWFMGFVNYQKTFTYVEHAISQFCLVTMGKIL